MPRQPFTRVTVVLPIPTRAEHHSLIPAVLDDLTRFCGGATYSSRLPSAFHGLWQDEQAEDGIERAERLVVIADAPLDIDDPLLNAYLSYMKLRCQRTFDEWIIWVMVQKVERIDAYDNEK